MSPSFDINLKRILNVLMRPIFFKQVVGSQARILYSDQNGRKEIATAFNEAVGSKKLKVCTWKIGKKLVDCTQVLFKVYTHYVYVIIIYYEYVPFPFTLAFAFICFSQGPVVISRDHHDVSGTDSPYRETSNIYDGSAFCAGTVYTGLF